MVLLFPSLVCTTFGKKIKITKYRPFLTSMATKIPTSVGSCASLKSQGVLSPQASWRQQLHCPGENKTPSFDKCQTEKLSQVSALFMVGGGERSNETVALKQNLAHLSRTIHASACPYSPSAWLSALAPHRCPL